MPKLTVLRAAAALGLLLATFLAATSAFGLEEPPPPPPVVEEPDPRRPDGAFFDPRLIGPGWLEFEGAIDAFSPRSPLEAPVLNAVKVVAGFNHSCALTDVGGVRCWGDNYFGQLGDGTRTYRTTPVDVVGLTSGVLDISSSHNHTCALTAATGVRCWGYNQHGELGNGSQINSLVPVDVFGLQSGVARISAGGFHTCVTMWNGGLKCWGANWHGQVGDGSIHDRYTPVDVVELTSGTIGLTTGKFHTCAVKENRQVKCWGYNQFGQQGNGSTVDNHIPRKVIGLGEGTREVYAGGLHTCAWTLDDKIKCWGDNSAGQLGVGGIEKSTVPQRVDGLTGLIVGMSLGGLHTCGITIDGGLKCWGNNWGGQLGNTGTTDSSWPTDVVYLPGWINSVSAGDSHTCATSVEGLALCWGSNGIGQLGIAASGLSTEPQDVTNLSGAIASASGGSSHACALTSSGGIQCWGNNKYGQLGDGTFINRVAPVDVINLTEPAVKVETGLYHTCAVMASGALKCWGDNSDGQLGDNTTEGKPSPVAVWDFPSGAVNVSAGASHTCALTDAGGVKCWGKNSRGRIGDGTNIQRLTPVDVYGQTSGVVALEVGGHHSCILKNNGVVRCWGSNTNGQIGDGTSADRWIPTVVSGLSGTVLSIALGDGHTCALFTSGAADCWGANVSGQLGDGTAITRYLPAPVYGLPGPALSLSAGDFHNCAIITGGSVYCWGDNWLGQIGDGTTTERLLPTLVQGLPTNVSAMIGGSQFTCSLLDDGSMKCWGSGSNGQLGTGNTPWETAPIVVVGLTPASLAINHQNGQAGSYFHVLGEDFLPGGTARVTLNGYEFAQDILVDSAGAFGLIIATDQAGDGDYFLHVEGTLKAMIIFHLDPAGPLHPQSGSGVLLNVPPGLGLAEHVYLPVGER